MHFGEPSSTTTRLRGPAAPRRRHRHRHHRRRLRRGRGRHAARPRAAPASRATTTRSSAPSATTSTRASARARKGFPRFTDPRLRGPERLRGLRADGDRALARALRRRRASTCCCCTTPTAPATRARPCGTRWARCATTGLTAQLGVAPGPANGFTLDVIDCFERFGDRIDWAMLILNPLEPWPGELALARPRAHGVDVITRVVDYGGLFHDDVLERPRASRARPPRLPARGLGRARPRAARADAARSPSATA